MRLTNRFSVMGRKYDLAYGQANTWKRKLKNDRYELIENAIDKLGQLEDIEERIGIDLVTLFMILEMFDKTIRNGECGDSYINFPDGTTFSTDMGYVEEFIERFKKLINDYGKTWTLAKENGWE